MYLLLSSDSTQWPFCPWNVPILTHSHIICHLDTLSDTTHLYQRYIWFPGNSPHLFAIKLILHFTLVRKCFKRCCLPPRHVSQKNIRWCRLEAKQRVKRAQTRERGPPSVTEVGDGSQMIKTRIIYKGVTTNYFSLMNVNEVF